MWVKEGGREGGKWPRRQADSVISAVPAVTFIHISKRMAGVRKEQAGIMKPVLEATRYKREEVEEAEERRGWWWINEEQQGWFLRVRQGWSCIYTCPSRLQGWKGTSGDQISGSRVLGQESRCCFPPGRQTLCCRWNPADCLHLQTQNAFGTEHGRRCVPDSPTAPRLLLHNAVSTVRWIRINEWVNGAEHREQRGDGFSTSSPSGTAK